MAAEWPEERLLHLVAVGAAPTSAAVMLTVDLMNGLAFQRCYDHQCVVRLPGGGYR